MIGSVRADSLLQNGKKDGKKSRNLPHFALTRHKRCDILIMENPVFYETKKGWKIL